ncbi:MAG: hypothetical protein GY925_17610 [Actinomycetia bacterium]|nr:hypothetical protein [Actinomycetes bacterium]
MDHKSVKRMIRVGVVLTALAAVGLIAVGQSGSGANGAQSLQNADVRTDTPVATDGRAYAGTQRGDRIVVGGTFTSLEPDEGKTAISQAYLYVYDVNSGDLDPNQFTLDNRVSVVIPASEDDAVFVGGRFTDIGGTTRQKLAKIDLDAGTVITEFVAHTDGQVKDLVLVGDTLFLTGGFTQVNSVERLGLAAVDATTGAVRTDFDFPLTTYIGQVDGAIGQRLGTTPDDQTLVVMHRGKFVDGLDHRGIAMIDIAATPALLPWRTDFWDSTTVISIVDGEVSPDGTYLVVGGGWGDSPPWRDTAVAFPVTGGPDTDPLWVTRNHDSTFAVAIDDNAVYIGGHFCWTEGPTTPEPWGNPPSGSCPNKTRNDPTEVYRDTFAALDPTTGKAIKYAPDSDARNGIRSIEIVPAGMLVGGDQTWTADVRTGRSALFDIAEAREDLALSGTATHSSSWGGHEPERAIDGNRDRHLFSHTIAATNSEAQPWWSVDLGEVKPVSTISLWTRSDCCLSEFSDVWVFTSEQPFASDNPAILSQDPNVVSTFLAGSQDRMTSVDSWTDARYVRVQLDGTGQLFLSEVSVYLDTGIGGPDATPPSATFDSPADGGEVQAPIRLVGTASDNQSVDGILVEVQNRDTSSWLRFDGSWGSWQQQFATMAGPGATSTDWTFDIAAAVPGRYKASVRAVDAAGNSHDLMTVKFEVVGGGATPASVTISSPQDDELIAGSSLNAVGTATDAVEVGAVKVSVRDRSTDLWLHSDGSFGSWQDHEATLATPGAASTDWTFSSALAAGSYKLFVTVIDAEGVAASETTAKFVVGADDEVPTVTVTSPTLDQQVPVGMVDLAGTATDNTSVVQVEFALRDRVSKQWLQPDGTWGSWTRLEAIPSNQGTQLSGWSYQQNLPAGSYKMYVISYDQAGNESAEFIWTFAVA